jgi:hypothetical protein
MCETFLICTIVLVCVNNNIIYLNVKKIILSVHVFECTSKMHVCMNNNYIHSSNLFLCVRDYEVIMV